MRAGDELLAPLHRTGAFTRVLEAVVAGPEPTPVNPALVNAMTSSGETFRVVDGVQEAVERVAWEARTFRALGLL